MKNYPQVERVLAGQSMFLVLTKNKYGVDVRVCTNEKQALEAKAAIEASQEYAHSQEYAETWCRIKKINADDFFSVAQIQL